MKIPDTTKKPRFYVASSHNNALSSWDTLDKARARIDRIQTHDPDQFIMGIVTTDTNGRGFISKHQKLITPIPGGMEPGGPAYVVTSYDQGIHFHLVSKVVWDEYMLKINNTIGNTIDKLFPAQEDDISDDPAFKEHVVYFGGLWKLLKHVEKTRLTIVNTHEE